MWQKLVTSVEGIASECGCTIRFKARESIIGSIGWLRAWNECRWWLNFQEVGYSSWRWRHAHAPRRWPRKQSKADCDNYGALHVITCVSAVRASTMAPNSGTLCHLFMPPRATYYAPLSRYLSMSSANIGIFSLCTNTEQTSIKFVEVITRISQF